MSSPVFNNDKIIFDFKDYKKSLIAGTIILLIFLMIGAGFIVLMIYISVNQSIFSFNFKEMNFKVNSYEDFKKIGIIGLFALFFTLIPVYIFVKMIKNKSSNKYPECFIFNLQDEIFTVKEKGGNEDGFYFNEIAEFKMRTYQVRYGDKHPRYVTYYVICMKKKDGGLWDVYESDSKEKSENILNQLKEKINLSSAKTADYKSELPSNINVNKDESRILLAWKVKSKIGSIVFLFILLSAFFGIIYFVTEAIYILIFGAVFACIVIFLSIVFGKRDTNFKMPLCFMEINNDFLKYGIMDKKNIKKKILRNIKISEISKIKFDYDFEYENIYNEDRELVIYSRKSEKEIKNLQDNAIDIDQFKSSIKKEDKALRLKITGLSIVDLLQFEKYIESYLKSFGGNPL